MILAALAAGGKDLVHIDPRGIVLPHLHLQQAGIAHEGHEDVVEVVGDPPCEGTDGLHLLGLAELGLKALTFGDVPQEDEGDRLALIGGDRDRRLDVDDIAVLPQALELVAVRDCFAPLSPADCS